MKSAFIKSLCCILGLWATVGGSEAIEPSLPKDCANIDFTNTGRPVFIEKDGLAHGISMARNRFKVGEPIPVTIWLDNLSDSPTYYGMHCRKWDEGEIYNEQGQRFLSEREKVQATGRESVDVCSGTTELFIVPPHSCFGPKELGSYYTNWPIEHVLPPGRYSITPWKKDAMSSASHAGKTAGTATSAIGPALVFSVESDTEVPK